MAGTAEIHPAVALDLPTWGHVAAQESGQSTMIRIKIDDLAVKTFSAGTAALQVNLGKGLLGSSFDLHTIQDPEEKEVARRRFDCRKHLLNMRARNAEMADPESNGRTVMQQEDLQEWLDNLHLKLKQACSGVSTPSPATAPASSSQRPSRPSRRSVASIAVAATAQSKKGFNLPTPLLLSTLSPPPMSTLAPPPSPVSTSSGDPSIIHKFKAASGAVSHQHIVRPRSINGLADQGAAALTDGQYIERLQLALQQASVSSLQERLAERKVQSVMQLPSTSGSVRPKTTSHVKSPTKTRRHISPSKVSHRPKHQQHIIRPAKLKSTSSSLPASSPVPAAQSVPPLSTKSGKNGGGKGKTGRSSHRRADDVSSDSVALSNSISPSSDVMTTSRGHHIPRLSDIAGLPSRTETDKSTASRSFITGDFFNCGQTVDDIYQAAEHLILPPARRDVYLSSDQPSAVQYETGPLIQRQGSLAEDVEEIPIVEDFWGAVPDY
ncbi:uncharacterized protein LOC116932882 isoform X2 [Daphnia magna]|uniref:uncharacterized protein LOC116932882 isoform X2 n=1 Tax=Daphnia magna TaxID=35525 RepID=UPI001E1BA829|nr:uncharacterized protein LOC116932882 isoform X2 [Daphnia magna]